MGCKWQLGDEQYIRYHDSEWGVPLWDEQKIFEFLILEGVQAGLSWLTVLKRRENYRVVYDGFDPQEMAQWSDEKVAALMLDERIIRNRLKIESARKNAQAYLKMREQGESLADFFWAFVDGTPIDNRWCEESELPASTELSEKISKELKRRGFNFVGPTIIYAHMQAMGMVNDHLISCPRHAECKKGISE